MEKSSISTKAFSYVRMSTSDQLKGDSLKRQLDASEQYARQNGLVLVERLEDIGLSAFTGKHLKHGALGRFIEALRGGQIEPGSVLIVESLDRLSREHPLDAFSQFTEIISSGIKIVTLADSQEYTKESVGENPAQIFISIGAMLRANEESELKSKRLKHAWVTKRNLSNHAKLTSNCPAWLKYDRDTDSFVVIEEKCRAVKRIFEMSIDGFGTFAISKYLNEHADVYPPISSKHRQKRTRPIWHKSYVQKILNNRSVFGEFQPHTRVAGKRVPDGEPINGYYPAIVSKTDFQLAQARMAKRRVLGAGRKGKKYSNIFTKIAVCGNCGGTIVYQNKGQPPKGGTYLRCSNAASGLGCAAMSWPYNDFEQGFLQWISEIELASIMTASTSAQQRQRIELLNRIEALKQEIDEHAVQFENLVDNLSRVSGSAADKLAAVMETRSLVIDDLKAQKAQLELDLSVAESDLRPESASKLVEQIGLLQRGASDEETYHLRVMVRTRICSIIDYIKISNMDDWSGLSPTDIFPLPHDLLKQFQSLGVECFEDVQAFLTSRAGQTLMQAYHRHFVVKFRNGNSKTVYPFRRHILLDTTPSRLASN